MRFCYLESRNKEIRSTGYGSTGKKKKRKTQDKVNRLYSSRYRVNVGDEYHQERMTGETKAYPAEGGGQWVEAQRASKVQGGPMCHSTEASPTRHREAQGRSGTNTRTKHTAVSGARSSHRREALRRAKLCSP